ncbi:tail fiber assembly protein, partial [Shigella boydii]
MLHLKNITAGNPKTVEQYQLTKQYDVTWLFSEDGKNWYEELKNFASDTIKITYTGDGRVVWVGKDVTGIEPRNASVIEVPDIT